MVKFNAKNTGDQKRKKQEKEKNSRGEVEQELTEEEQEFLEREREREAYAAHEFTFGEGDLDSPEKSLDAFEAWLAAHKISTHMFGIEYEQDKTLETLSLPKFDLPGRDARTAARARVCARRGAR